MPDVNMASIMAKLRQWFNAPATQKDLKKMVRDIQTGLRPDSISGHGSGRIKTITDMSKAADILVEMIKAEAEAKGLPQSVLNNVRSLQHSTPYQDPHNKDQYRVDLFFTDDLSRPSLYAGSEGARNIVSLFNTGYSASKRVFGIWDSHRDLGIIASLPRRNGLYFIQIAISDFNDRYGAEYDAHAEINPDNSDYLMALEL